MKHFILAVALMLCGSVASAVDMPELAKKMSCTECHSIERKIVGPAWLDVANRYRGNDEAPLFLANKIKRGDFCVWGSLPMPEQHVSDEEAETLAKFILKLSGEPPIAVSGWPALSRPSRRDVLVFDFPSRHTLQGVTRPPMAVSSR